MGVSSKISVVLFLASARSFRSADLFAGVILLGAIGYVTALAMSIVEQRLLKWRSSGH
jgi:sulfonate transport system permease protein